MAHLYPSSYPKEPQPYLGYISLHDYQQSRSGFVQPTPLGLIPLNTSLNMQRKLRSMIMADEGTVGGEPTPSQENLLYASPAYPQPDFSSTQMRCCPCAQCTYLTEAGYSEYLKYEPSTIWPGVKLPEPQTQYGPITSQVQKNYASGFGGIQYQSWQRSQMLGPIAQDFTPAIVLPFQWELPALSQSVSPQEVFSHQSPAPSLSCGSTCSALSDSSREMVPSDINGNQLHTTLDTAFPYMPRRQLLGPGIARGENSRDNSMADFESPDDKMPDESDARFSSSTSTTHTDFAPYASSTGPVESGSRSRTSKISFRRTKTKDQLLVEWKLKGLSYKEIKEKGAFKEAESTLRGRFRTLTKDKEQRVRKPRWKKRDIRLLDEGVRILSKRVLCYEARPNDDSRSKRTASRKVRRCQTMKLRTPWKDVVGYIIEHGGSYRFGNATCKKKWAQLHAKDEGDEEEEGNKENKMTDGGEAEE